MMSTKSKIKWLQIYLHKSLQFRQDMYKPSYGSYANELIHVYCLMPNG
jgi:hypothetical protein